MAEISKFSKCHFCNNYIMDRFCAFKGGGVCHFELSAARIKIRADAYKLPVTELCWYVLLQNVLGGMNDAKHVD